MFGSERERERERGEMWGKEMDWRRKGEKEWEWSRIIKK